MNMTKTFQELATPYCEIHNCSKNFHKDFIGGAWFCPECAAETGEAFRKILNRLREHKND